MEPITQLLFNSLSYHLFQCSDCFSYKNELYKKIFSDTLHTWDVAEETEGDGDAGGVSRLQGRFNVT